MTPRVSPEKKRRSITSRPRYRCTRLKTAFEVADIPAAGQAAECIAGATFPVAVFPVAEGAFLVVMEAAFLMVAADTPADSLRAGAE